MNQILVLRLGDPASWVIVDAAGARLGPVATGSVADAAPLAAERRVIALVPGSEVTLADPELPARSVARLAQVAPFALEEQLAGDVEDFHFAVGRQGDDGRARVAAVLRTRMSAWFDGLGAAGLSPEAMYCETLCLPENPGKTVAVLENGLLTVQPPAGLPFALAVEPLTEAFALAGLEGEDRHVQLFVAQQDWDTSREVIDALREVAGSLDLQLLPDGALPLFAAGAVARPPLSLMSGPFAPRRGLAAQWRRWRLPAALAAALVAVVAGASIYDLVRYRAEERRLDAAIEQTFRVAMPDVQVISDPRQQMAQRLGSSAAADPEGLLGRLDAVAQAFGSVSGVQLRSLGWRNRMLDLRISAPASDTLTELARAVGQRGLSFDVQSTVPREGGVDGLVSIRSAGAT
jgi:general secretion pathway protein L